MKREALWVGIYFGLLGLLIILTAWFRPLGL